MQIYRFKFVSNDHQDLLPDDRNPKLSDEEWAYINSALEFKGVRKGKKWVPPPVFSESPRQPMPDIWSINVYCGAFAVNPMAFAKLSKFLKLAGEILPLPYKDLGLQICNITPCVDCVDQELSEWETDRLSRRLIKAAFKVDQLPKSTLFKIPQWPKEILCWEQTGDPETEFKACVEANKFKGGRKGNFFELVWEPSKPKRKASRT